MNLSAIVRGRARNGEREEREREKEREKRESREREREREREETERGKAAHPCVYFINFSCVINFLYQICYDVLL